MYPTPPTRRLTGYDEFRLEQPGALQQPVVVDLARLRVHLVRHRLEEDGRGRHLADGRG